MAGKYLIGIDEGTMSSRACIFDLEGNLLGSSAGEYGVTSPRPGWYEQDVEAMAKVIYAACQGAIREAGIDPNEIIAVGLSSQGAAFVPVDENDEVVRPCIGWQDVRGVPYFEELKPEVTPDEYYAISGIPFGTSPWSVSKILWIRDNEPDNYDRTACFALHQDYFLNALGVEGHYADIASASRYGIFDIDNHQYSDKLLDASDLSKETLAEVVKGGTQVGTVNAHVSELTSIPEGTPICVGAMDVNASILGLGVIEPGMAGTILGTYGTCIALSGEPVRDPNGAMVVMGNVGTRKWTMEGSSLAAASSYRWFRDTFGGLEVAMGTVLKEDPFELINRQIATSRAGARGLVFIPHLASAGAPRNNANARGVLLGLTLAHTKADIARAVMEGISMEIRDIIAAEERAGIDIKEVRITGGGTKSPMWNQIQADVYGVPARTVQTSETGSLGAAMLAGVGAGVFDDVEEAVGEMVHVTSVYEPNPDNTAIYDEVYEVYDTAFKGLSESDTYEKVSALQAKLGLE